MNNNSPLLLIALSSNASAIIISSVQYIARLFKIPICVFLRINSYTITRLNAKKIMKQVKYAESWRDDTPHGLICGKWFIGISNYDRYQNDTDVNIICTNKFYNDVVRHSDDEDDYINNNDATINSTDIPNENMSIDTVVKKISYYAKYVYLSDTIEYRMRKIMCPKLPVKPHQLTAIKQIIKIYEENQHCVALLYGAIGTMKSRTAEYLCQYMLNEMNYEGVSLVNEFNPFDKMNYFEMVYQDINPTKNCPLVIVLEEIDVNLTKIHNAAETTLENVQIKDKMSWNLFLDKFDRCMYKNVILLMTSNKPIDYFDSLDPAYMRTGRIDIELNYDELKNE